MNVIWLYGLSGSGKTTLGYRLSTVLGWSFLDADVLRVDKSVKKDFTRNGRLEFQTILRCETLRLLQDNNSVVVASITPYRELRVINRGFFSNYSFYEVYLKCDICVLIERDPKGLYKKAISKDIPCFTGISDIFEEYEGLSIGDPKPNLIVDTENYTEDESYNYLLTNVISWN